MSENINDNDGLLTDTSAQASADVSAQASDASFDDKTRKELERRDRELHDLKYQMSQMRAEAAELKKLKDLRRDDPLGAMRELGVDRMSIAEQLLNEGGNKQQLSPDVKALRDEFAEIKAENKKLRDEMKVGNARIQLSTAIRSNPNFRAINKLAHDNPYMLDRIYADIERSRQETGNADYYSVLKSHNEKIEDDILNNLPDLIASDRFCSKLSELMNKKPKSDQPDYRGNSRTLRNDMGSAPTKKVPRPKTSEEAMEFLLRQNLNFFDTDE